jgi:hypothetical protein
LAPSRTAQTGIAGALIVALREGVDRQRMRVDAVKVALERFLRQAGRHALEQAMAAVGGDDDRLAALGDARAGFALQREMTDHLAIAVPRHGRNKLAALDLVPVTAGREHLRVHVVMAIDFEKAARNRRRIASLRQVDDVVRLARRECRRGYRYFGIRQKGRLRPSGQALVNADLPSVDSVLMAGNAGDARHSTGERSNDLRKAGIAVQQDADCGLLMRAKDGDVGPFASTSMRAQRLPGMGSVVCDQARGRTGYAFRERCFADKRAHELTALRLEHDLQLGTMDNGRCFHGAGSREFQQVAASTVLCPFLKRFAL